MRIEFDTLEQAWGHSPERVLITDPDGIAFLASDDSAYLVGETVDITGGLHMR